MVTATSRIQHVDIARGLLVTGVALTHNHPLMVEAGWRPLSDALSFRLPLLFFVSGVFLSMLMPFREQVLRKAESILKPYFAVGLLVVLSMQVGFFKSIGDMGDGLRSFLLASGETIPWPWEPMWFLPTLFFGSLGAVLIWRWAGLSRERMAYSAGVLGVLLLLSVGLVNISKDLPIHHSALLKEWRFTTGMPWNVDLVPLAAFFTALGALLRPQIIAFRFSWRMTLLAAVVYCLTLALLDNKIDLNYRVYKMLGSTLLVVTGGYLLLALSLALSHMRRTGAAFKLLGASSLFVLIFHAPVQDMMGWLMYAAAGKWLSHEVIGLVSLVLALCLPVLLWQVARRSRWLSLIFLPSKQSLAPLATRS